MYKVTKTLTGSFVVKFKCPKCSSSLQDELLKAGKMDHCPDCKADFVIPGTKERQELEAKLADRAEKARILKETRDQEAKQRAETERIEKEKAAKIESERLEKLKASQSPPIPPTQVQQPKKESIESLALTLATMQHKQSWKAVRNAIAGILLIVVAVFFAVAQPSPYFTKDTIFSQILQEVIETQQGVRTVAAGVLFWLGVARLISC